MMFNKTPGYSIRPSLGFNHPAGHNAIGNVVNAEFDLDAHGGELSAEVAEDVGNGDLGALHSADLALRRGVLAVRLALLALRGQDAAARRAHVTEREIRRPHQPVVQQEHGAVRDERVALHLTETDTPFFLRPFTG